MSASEFACPTCGSDHTRRVEMVWMAGNSESVTDGALADGVTDGEWLTGRSWSSSDLAKSIAPPTQRAAVSDAPGFYGRGCLGLIGWIVGGAILCTVLAAFPVLVIVVVGVALIGGLVQMFRLLGGRPKLTDDQRAAHREWKADYAEWQRKWLCQRCGETFIPEGA